jgi:hypothetical protein
VQSSDNAALAAGLVRAGVSHFADRVVEDAGDVSCIFLTAHINAQVRPEAQAAAA